MELEDDDFAQIVSEVAMEFGRVTMRREASQQAIECVVKRVVHFNGVFTWKPTMRKWRCEA